jgi:hypothetical protein
MILVEEVIRATSLKPAADAGGRTGLYVSLKNSVFALLVYHIDQGNAATIALTPLQATNVSGGSAKAIPVVPIWAVLDAASSSVPVRQTDAASFTTDAAVKVKIVIFMIEPARLDNNNGFLCVAAQTGASNAANITSATVETQPRQVGAAPVNAMVN